MFRRTAVQAVPLLVAAAILGVCRSVMAQVPAVPVATGQPQNGVAIIPILPEPQPWLLNDLRSKQGTADAPGTPSEPPGGRGWRSRVFRYDPPAEPTPAWASPVQTTITNKNRGVRTGMVGDAWASPGQTTANREGQSGWALSRTLEVNRPPAAAAATGGYVTTGQIVFEEQPKAAPASRGPAALPPPVPAPSQHAPRAMPTTAVMSSQPAPRAMPTPPTAVLQRPIVVPPPPPALPSPTQPKAVAPVRIVLPPNWGGDDPALDPRNILLRTRVVCGELARDVQLVPQADNTLTVRVLVVDPRLQTLVREKLMHLSEMESPSIRLSVEVER